MALARASPMPGSCASSASVALFRSSLPTDPAALSLAASFVALALLVASLALSFWLSALSRSLLPSFFSASFFSFRADVLLSAASLILPDSESFASVTFSRAPDSSSDLSAACSDGAPNASVSAASRPSAGVRIEERVGFWFFFMNIFPEHVWCRPRAEAGTDDDAFIRAAAVDGTLMKTADRVPKPGPRIAPAA